MSTSNSSNVLRTVYLSVLAQHIKSNGLGWALKKIILRVLKELAWVFMLPLAICLHILGIRNLLIRVEHIGHLAAEFDAHVKAKELGLLPAGHRLYFVVAPAKRVSNNHLLNYWKSKFLIITNSFACEVLSLLSRRYFMRYDVSHYISSFFGTQEIYRINQLWQDRPPILTLSDEDEKWSMSILEQLGINKNQWYVCLHVREGGYLPHNELIQSHRNASIQNMRLAIDEIVKRGGVVVRMGDASMTPLPKMPGVIDYAHHPLKSERLDIVLCAKAKFFLGCTSGLSFVSMVFGVPVAQANMIPVEALGVCKRDLSIPKLLWSDSEKRYLNFTEILSSPIGGFYFTHQYKEAGLHPVENSPEDILAMTIEMLNRLDGKFVLDSDEEELHSRYLALFKPGHYSYGATSRVCAAFLRNNKYLL